MQSFPQPIPTCFVDGKPVTVRYAHLATPAELRDTIKTALELLEADEILAAYDVLRKAKL